MSGLTSNGHDVALSYAALALTPSLKRQLRSLIAGWEAAAMACQEHVFSLEVSASPAYWMRRLPDCVEYPFGHTVDTMAWAAIPVSPIAELAIGLDEIRKKQGRSIDRVCTATECETIVISGSRGVYFEARERHGDGVVWTNPLPDWVIDWVLSEEEE
jgi:hypothetical protein